MLIWVLIRVTCIGDQENRKDEAEQSHQLCKRRGLLLLEEVWCFPPEDECTCKHHSDLHKWVHQLIIYNIGYFSKRPMFERCWQTTQIPKNLMEFLP